MMRLEVSNSSTACKAYVYSHRLIQDDFEFNTLYCHQVVVEGGEAHSLKSAYQQTPLIVLKYFSLVDLGHYFVGLEGIHIMTTNLLKL